MKIYLDNLTNELVITKGNSEKRYPKGTLKRSKETVNGIDKITLEPVVGTHQTGVFKVDFQNILNENDNVYGNVNSFFTAINGNFNTSSGGSGEVISEFSGLVYDEDNEAISQKITGKKFRFTRISHAYFGGTDEVQFIVDFSGGEIEEDLSLSINTDNSISFEGDLISAETIGDDTVIVTLLTSQEYNLLFLSGFARVETIEN